jgi:hypothetical protein
MELCTLERMVKEGLNEGYGIPHWHLGNTKQLTQATSICDGIANERSRWLPRQIQDTTYTFSICQKVCLHLFAFSSVYLLLFIIRKVSSRTIY